MYLSLKKHRRRILKIFAYFFTKEETKKSSETVMLFDDCFCKLRSYFVSVCSDQGLLQKQTIFSEPVCPWPTFIVYFLLSAQQKIKMVKKGTKSTSSRNSSSIRFWKSYVSFLNTLFRLLYQKMSKEGRLEISRM